MALNGFKHVLDECGQVIRGFKHDLLVYYLVLEVFEHVSIKFGISFCWLETRQTVFFSLVVFDQVLFGREQFLRDVNSMSKILGRLYLDFENVLLRFEQDLVVFKPVLDGFKLFC